MPGVLCPYAATNNSLTLLSWLITSYMASRELYYTFSSTGNLFRQASLTMHFRHPGCLSLPDDNPITKWLWLANKECNMVICQCAVERFQVISYLNIMVGGFLIGCHEKVFCEVYPFPKYPSLIPKTDYIGIIFTKKRMKPYISNGLKLQWI